MPARQTDGRRCGFTIVELISVISIIVVLAGLLLPAVQQTREAARRTTCTNRLKQQGLALLAFDSTFKTFPAGAEADTLHAWSSRILPYLEQSNLYQQLNFRVPWDAGGNADWSRRRLEMFSCPTSWKDYPGSTDYSGISGSTHKATTNLASNGIFFPVGRSARPVSIAEITDGTSNTIAIAEAVAVGENNHGFWACGFNCIGHDDGPINNRSGGQNEIASLHPGGANAAFADGSVRFLSETLPLDIVGALCTRNNQEIVSDF
ncbi:DUF1559 domain-containing protein [Planctomycetaceae bacterium SH139]